MDLKTYRIEALLCDIRSRENVGSIFRTADAAGVSKLYLCGITPTPPHDKISKTALGAEENIPWEHHLQSWRLLEKFKKEGKIILMLEQDKTSESIFSFVEKFSKNWSKNESTQGPKTDSRDNSEKNASPEQKNQIVLVVGNEVHGISKNLLKYASQVIEIPMKGSKESLNVAVAFGIAVYALMPQKP